MSARHQSPEVFGPAVRWVNPFKIRTYRTPEGWTATYRQGSSNSASSGCATKAEAVARLRRLLTMRVTLVDGKFVEVP